MLLLARLFIPNYKNTDDPTVRRRYAQLTGAAGIVLNLFLSVLKLIAGAISGSIAITADALNNLSDAGTSLVTIVSFKLAEAPADRKHPFGHGRIEYVGGLIVAGMILLVGYELLRDSIAKILSPEPIAFHYSSLVILIVSVLVKLYIFSYNRKIGEMIRSVAMKAAALDSLSDCVSTGAVIVGFLIYGIFSVDLDGWIGLLVVGFIVKTGLEAAKESLAPLLGEKPDPAFVAEIRKTVLDSDGIIGLHDLIVHNYGVGANMISLHAEIPAGMSFTDAHELIDRLEHELKEKFGVSVTIHMDPVEAETEQSHYYREMLEKILSELGVTMHDFRMTEGKHRKNLIFDIVVPFQHPKKDLELVQLIKERIRAQDDSVDAVINVDKELI
ncbi:MAG: cation diffusion facilitator family transporter [Bacteroides sp.]|nr:cation diffusion facilitator family transporter [Roseburia sp.]MCM1461179.1 cation diffusion facilitator family transporter [Bacteroides sp.]